MGLIAVSFLAQQATPDTSGYMIAGYVVIFVVMLVYLASLVVRHRNLKADYETLQEIEQGEGIQAASGSLPAEGQPAQK